MMTFFVSNDSEPPLVVVENNVHLEDDEKRTLMDNKETFASRPNNGVTENNSQQKNNTFHDNLQTNSSSQSKDNKPLNMENPLEKNSDQTMQGKILK